MNYNQFINLEDVKNFIEWLPKYIKKISYLEYYHKKDKRTYKFNSFEDMCYNYTWNKEGYQDTIRTTRNFSSELKKAINQKDSGLACKISKQILEWGGTTRGNNLPYLENMVQKDLLIETYKNILLRFGDLETINLSTEDNFIKKLKNNSGYVKIYCFLLNNGLVIYDSRVAASIGYFIKIWHEKNNFNSLPQILKIHQMPGRMNSKGKFLHKRKYQIFSYCSRDEHFTIDSIKTAWIMLKVLKDNKNLFSKSGLLNNRMIDFQMALFIMGYDLDELESSILLK